MYFKQKPLAMAVSALLVTGTLLSGCGGSSSSSNDVDSGGNSIINVSGGYSGGGVAGYGGRGGVVDVYLMGGTGGIEVKKTGSASTAFSSQANKITPHFGVNPLMIDNDTALPLPTYYITRVDGAVIEAGSTYVGSDGVMRIATDGNTNYSSDAMVEDGTLYRWSGKPNELYIAIGNDTTADLAPAGTPYMRLSNTRIYVADGDDTVADPVVTGMKVANGATLTMPLNYTGVTSLALHNDLVNNGAITTPDYTGTTRGALRFSVSSFLNSGTIDTSGSGSVIHGGYTNVFAKYAAINSGVINTAGANNPAGTGGAAGYINLSGEYYTENTAQLIASGGNGSGAAGGDGNWVEIYSRRGPVYNKGDIYSNGGNGNQGGVGGAVYIGNDEIGNTLNAGTIDTSGGNGSAGRGGNAGDIYLYNYGGRLASSGDIAARGGSAAAAGNNAGSGGDISLYNAPGSAVWGNYATSPHEGIELSGVIDLGGGSTTGSGNGGRGGSLYASTDDRGNGRERTVSDQAITLLGYADVDAKGGNGQYPGEGGNYNLYADYGWDEATSIYGFVGPVKNAAHIEVSAGDYTGSANTDWHYARGGSVSFETSDHYGRLNPAATVSNSGHITANGADGRAARGGTYLRSGWVYMWGYNGVNNSGELIINGGKDLSVDGGTTGRGGNSNWVGLYAEMGAVVNSGNITANGGDGGFSGGYGSGWTAFYAPEVKNSGKIAAKGGDVNTALATHYPGYGGWVWMMGSDGPTSVSNSASVTLTPGIGYQDVYPNNAGYYKVIGSHCEGDC